MAKQISLVINVDLVASIADDSARMCVTLKNGVKFMATRFKAGADGEDTYLEVNEFMSPNSDPKSDAYQQFIKQFDKSGTARSMRALDDGALYTTCDFPAVEGNTELTISEAGLKAALLAWETSHRAGECMTINEAMAEPLDVAVAQSFASLLGRIRLAQEAVGIPFTSASNPGLVAA